MSGLLPSADAGRRGSHGSAVRTRAIGGERDKDSDSADDVLQALGYKSELVRTRSTWHVAFMSFVLASIPYGLATTLYYPLQGGGPVVVIWGWVLVSLIILCVAASLGEITSVYPTAGGVYYQTFMLAPHSIRRVLAYTCGWAYVVGNITITLAVQFGTTLFFVACVNVFESEPGVGVWQAETYQVFLTFLAITLLCNAISVFGNKFLPLLDVSFCVSSPRISSLPRSSRPTSLSRGPWQPHRPSVHARHHADLIIPPKDLCHLLDFCWPHCHHDHRPRRGQGGTPRRRVRFRRL